MKKASPENKRKNNNPREPDPVRDHLRAYYLHTLRHKWPWLNADEYSRLFPEKGPVSAGAAAGEIFAGDRKNDWPGRYESFLQAEYGRAFRQGKGIYYTPPQVAEYIAERILAHFGAPEKHQEIRVLDPACGAGILLRHMYLALGRKMPQAGRNMLRRQIHGFDLDERALYICRYQIALAELSLSEDPGAFSGWLAAQESVITCEDFLRCGTKDHFDLIIGNPPFIGFKKYSGEDKRYYSENFFCYEGKADLWYYFLEKSIRLLAPDGIIGFVLPRYFQWANHARGLREVLGREAEILEIVEDRRHIKFPQAQNHCSILFLKRKSEVSLGRVLFRIPEAAKNGDFIFRDRYIKPEHLSADGWRLLTPSAGKILARLKKISVNLEDIAVIANGILTGLDRYRGGPGFVLTEEEVRLLDLERELIRPWYKGKDIRRYKLKKSGLWLLYLTPETPLDDYPKTAAFIKEKKQALSARKCGYSAWWALARAKTGLPWQRPKLLSPYRAAENTFAPDMDGGYCSLDCTLVFPKDDADFWVLTAMLNSKLLSALYSLQSKRMGVLREYYPHSLSKLGIPWEFSGALKRKIGGMAVELFRSQQDQKWQEADLEVNRLINEACKVTFSEIEELAWLQKEGL